MSEMKKDEAPEVFVLSKEEALDNFELLMEFQYGDPETSRKAFEKLKEVRKD